MKKILFKNRFDNNWNYSLKCDRGLHFKVNWCGSCCQPQLHHFCESLVKIGRIVAEIWFLYMVTVIYIFKVSWYNFLLQATLNSFLWKFGKNWLYSSWDTAIFINCEWPWSTFSRSEDQTFFVAGRYTIIVVEFCLNCFKDSRNGETLPLLWTWSMMSRSSSQFLFYSLLLSQTHGEWMKKIRSIVPQIIDVFTFFSCKTFFTWKMKAKLCGNPCHITPFCRTRIPLKSVTHLKMLSYRYLRDL